MHVYYTPFSEENQLAVEKIFPNAKIEYVDVEIETTTNFLKNIKRKSIQMGNQLKLKNKSPVYFVIFQKQGKFNIVLVNRNNNQKEALIEISKDLTKSSLELLKDTLSNKKIITF